MAERRKIQMADRSLSPYLIWIAAICITIFYVAGTSGAAAMYYASMPVSFCLCFLAGLIAGGCAVTAKQVKLRLRRGKLTDGMLFYRSARVASLLLALLVSVIFGVFSERIAGFMGERYSYLVILSLIPALLSGSQLGPMLGYLRAVNLKRLQVISLLVLAVGTIVLSAIASGILRGKADGIGLLLRKQELIYVYAGAGLGIGISGAFVITWLVTGLFCLLVSRDLRTREDALRIDHDEQMRGILPYYLRLIAAPLIFSLIPAVMIITDFRLGFSFGSGGGSRGYNANTWGGFAGGCLPVLLGVGACCALPFTGMPARLCRLMNRGRDNAVRYEFSMTMRLLGYIGIPASAFLFGAAKPIVQIVHAGFGQAARNGAILPMKLGCVSAFLFAAAIVFIFLFFETDYQSLLILSEVIAFLIQTLVFIVLGQNLSFKIEAAGIALAVFLAVFDMAALLLGRRELLARTDTSFFVDFALILLASAVADIPVILLNDFMTDEIIPVGGAVILLILFVLLYWVFSLLFRAADLVNVQRIPGGRYVIMLARLMGIYKE